jgi:outer membrane protein assembly factor BamB
MLGGATAAGGLVFAGAVNGTLYAFDAATGQSRWQRDLGAGFGSAPVVYAVGGREYLAVVSGGAAIAAINQLGPVGGRLYVFTLAWGTAPARGG